MVADIPIDHQTIKEANSSFLKESNDGVTIAYISVYPTVLSIIDKAEIVTGDTENTARKWVWCT